MMRPLEVNPPELEKVMDELGVEPGDRAAFLRGLNVLSASYTATPQDELKFRLNARIRGDDPGHPVNTRYWPSDAR